MSFFNPFKRKTTTKPTDPVNASFDQQKERAGLLVTTELHKALEECKARVARIAKECRMRNKKFRDIEFDLENEKYMCLDGLLLGSEIYAPSDVQRVTQIFENPQFFVDGADSNDIVQGNVGDCWFLSALATMATAKGLVESFCVARDEQVGVYGFIFFRDTAWVVVIIDDLLYTSIPKFEELSSGERHLYHDDKEQYNTSARKSGKSLYFAKSGTQGETWVPLIEKAYAKLHGDYASLSGGQACEAIEDLTGGVSTSFPSKDILDIDKFWKEELLKANKDRLFGCVYNTIDPNRSGDPYVKVNGLIGSHAYSVLRAVECKGKRFLVVRNPWGRSEWTGPWSDGSKEWTKEWLSILPELGHVFGDDGQFIMEYHDFLASWEQIDRTLLFGSEWVMSSQWLEVTTRPLPSTWSYGDVSFTITLPKPSFTVIVLSKLDERYFKDISGNIVWTFDFILFKKGETEPLAESSHSRSRSRSVNLEMDLEAGEYVVHVRLDPIPYRGEHYFPILDDGGHWRKRKLSRVLTERAKSQSIASNFKAVDQKDSLPIPLKSLAGQDLTERNKKTLESAEAARREASILLLKTTSTMTTTATPATVVSSSNVSLDINGDKTESEPQIDNEDSLSDYVTDDGTDIDKDSVEVNDPTHPTVTLGHENLSGERYSLLDAVSRLETRPVLPRVSPVSDGRSLVMGLRVYTNKAAPAVIGGQLSCEMGIP